MDMCSGTDPARGHLLVHRMPAISQVLAVSPELGTREDRLSSKPLTLRAPRRPQGTSAPSAARQPSSSLSPGTVPGSDLDVRLPGL